MHHRLEDCRRKPGARGSLRLGLLLKSKGGVRAKVNYNSGVWFSFWLRPCINPAASKTYSIAGTLHAQGSEATADLVGDFDSAQALSHKIRNLQKHQWGEYFGSPGYRSAGHLRPIHSGSMRNVNHLDARGVTNSLVSRRAAIRGSRDKSQMLK